MSGHLWSWLLGVGFYGHTTKCAHAVAVCLVTDYDMEVVLLHDGDGSDRPWHHCGARAVVLIAAQLTTDGGAEDRGQPGSSLTQPARRVLCLLAEVDLATGAVTAPGGITSRSAYAFAALWSLKGAIAPVLRCANRLL